MDAKELVLVAQRSNMNADQMDSIADQWVAESQKRVTEEAKASALNQANVCRLAANRMRTNQ